jgi:hypothetical protein
MIVNSKNRFAQPNCTNNKKSSHFKYRLYSDKKVIVWQSFSFDFKNIIITSGAKCHEQNDVKGDVLKHLQCAT